MDIKELKILVSSNLAFAELLHSYLQGYGEELPVAYGKASNKSKRLRKLIGPDRKLDLSKDSEGMRGLLVHKDRRIRKLAEAKLACSSWPLHQKRVTNLISYAAVRNGKIGIPVKYSGAHTHRNSGSDGVNFYNFPKRPKKGYELIMDIKKLVRAPKGYELLTFDYAQIEARYLAYLARQIDLVEAFREGRDVYSEAATYVFDRQTRKPRPSDPLPIVKGLTIRRNFGKQEILGCGYGMGPTTFYNRCVDDESLRGIVTPQLAEKIVKSYRKTYTMIPKFWKELENIFKFVVKYPEEKMTTVHSIGIEHEQFNNQIILTLPSGSKLYYPDTVKNRSSGNLKWRHSRGASFWGGAMTENVIQSTCRDILVEAILATKKAGYTIVADLYDAFTVLVKKEQTKEAKEELTNIVTVPPVWCEGVPLAVEAEISETL